MEDLYCLDWQTCKACGKKTESFQQSLKHLWIHTADVPNSDPGLQVANALPGSWKMRVVSFGLGKVWDGHGPAVSGSKWIFESRM